MSVPSYLAGFDSASTMVMATGKVLHGESFPALGNPPFLRPLARATRWLPPRVRGKLFLGFGALETISSRRLGGLDLEEASEWVASSYPQGRYPQVAVGSSSGALVYLNAALGMPWLPQTLLVPVRQRVHPDDPVGALEKGRGPGRTFVEKHPDIQLHHMHDAAQDRQMVRALTYFRYKRRTLGEGYERFLDERLAPGGTILLSECTASWSTTTVGERHVFQHGALGGATEDEFHRGGPRVEEYLAAQDSPVRSWPEPEPDTRSPEAEWGFAPALRDDVLRYAAERGVRVRRLVFDHPDALSPLVADLYRWWYARRNIPANRLFVGSFAISSPWWALRTGSVPYWMFFNEENSMRRLVDYLDAREPFDDVLLTLFQNGVETIGQPSGEAWQQVLDRARRTGRYAGTDLEDFPFDFAQFGSYDRELARFPARYPVPAPLSMPELEEFLAQAGDYEGVRWEDVAVTR
ncbi:hypothetical protein [Cellulomonas bogoriensis]|uniref:Uncharacterized protein n=1 Tax=Cellulomonas bogoriensis 69B4 = DSM 16987 TaxID=1386082 RepID=A0A0A0C045_9CELL|nr:hypothetical protein [Cellulomonas bogoriensis]KGM13292.1 hypothetical protein N869_16645 [Cellulomonas bogoriensis 69B4 = DSM 16987]